MKKLTLDVPTMYGDHHVIEVRRLLLEIAGVKDVYASSAFQTVEVTYDEEQTNEDEIRSRLEQAGYMGELPMPVETGTAGAESNGRKAYFRHSAALETARETITFQQQVPFTGRPLWPCPGMGLLKKQDDMQ